MVNKILMKSLEGRTFENFGQLAKYLRVNENLGTRILAREMGYHSSYSGFIYNVERNIRSPSPKMIWDYIGFFEIDPKYAIELDAEDWKNKRIKKLLEYKKP